MTDVPLADTFQFDAQGFIVLRGVLDAVATVWLEPDDVARIDPEGRSLVNVNTPEDLARVEEILAGS